MSWWAVRPPTSVGSIAASMLNVAKCYIHSCCFSSSKTNEGIWVYSLPVESDLYALWNVNVQCVLFWQWRRFIMFYYSCWEPCNVNSSVKWKETFENNCSAHLSTGWFCLRLSCELLHLLLDPLVSPGRWCVDVWWLVNPVIQENLEQTQL